MKTIHTIITATCCLLVINFTSVLKADERLIAVEMADGNLVTFIMSPAEITAEDAAKATLERRKSSITEIPKKRVVTYEMGEGDHTISFPMTEKEIAAEDAMHASQEARRIKYIRKSEPEYELIELAESGHYLTFPITDKRPNNTDVIEIVKRFDR